MATRGWEKVVAQEQAHPVRRNKFNAKAVVLPDGTRFDSRGEYRRYEQLLLEVAAGEIRALKVHPEVCLVAAQFGPGNRHVPEICYRPDFSYVLVVTGRTIYEDWKPRPKTARDSLIEKLWAHFGPGDLIITSQKGVLRTIEYLPIT